MYVIIVGAGRIGSRLAKILTDEQHDVVVIDKDGDVCHEIANELECITIRGDGSKPKILEEAGIHEADTVLALTGSDETNLVVSLMAKQLGAKHVVARLAAIHYEEDVLKRLGLDLVIYPEAAAADYVAELIMKPDLVNMAFMSRGPGEIIEIEVKKKSKLVGKKVKDIEKLEELSLVGILNEGGLILPEPNIKIKVGDKLMVLAKKKDAKKIRKLFGKR